MNITDRIEEMRSRLSRILGRHISPEEFTRLVITEGLRTILLKIETSENQMEGD